MVSNGEPETEDKRINQGVKNRRNKYINYKVNNEGVHAL